MQEGQDKIYYSAAENFNTAKSSPHLEVFRKKGIEVLLLSDRVDEWLMSHLAEYSGKTLQDVGKGELDLGDLDTEEEKQAQEKVAEELKPLLERVKKVLEGDVDEVRINHRLTESPACVVVAEHELGPQRRRILEQAGQALPDSKPSLELNPEERRVGKACSARGAAEQEERKR